MASIFFARINGADVSFDELFDEDIIGDGPTAPFLEIGGVPVKYAALSYGTKRADVNFETAAWLDVANLWAAKGTATYINQNAIPSSIESYQQNSAAPVTATVSFSFKRDGTTDCAPSEVGSGIWKTPPAANAGDDYDIRFTQVSAFGSGSMSGTLNIWIQISQTRGITLSVTRNSAGAVLVWRRIRIEIRRRSNGLVLYMFEVYMQAEADIS